MPHYPPPPHTHTHKRSRSAAGSDARPKSPSGARGPRGRCTRARRRGRLCWWTTAPAAAGASRIWMPVAGSRRRGRGPLGVGVVVRRAVVVGRRRRPPRSSFGCRWRRRWRGGPRLSRELGRGGLGGTWDARRVGLSPAAFPSTSFHSFVCRVDFVDAVYRERRGFGGMACWLKERKAFDRPMRICFPFSVASSLACLSLVSRLSRTSTYTLLD